MGNGESIRHRVFRSDRRCGGAGQVPGVHRRYHPVEWSWFRRYAWVYDVYACEPESAVVA
jgi:hypothetical protein